MKNLLKVDFYRVIKSKLTIAVLIIDIVLPIMLVLMYYGISKIMEATMAEAGVPGMDVFFTGRGLIGAAFSLSDNVGLIIPIFSAVLVFNDLSSGILRNKLMLGYTRSQIYFSHLITSCIFNVIAMLLYFFVLLGFSAILLPYGRDFDTQEFVNVLYYVINGCFVFMFITTITSIFSLNFKTLAPIILLTLLCSIVISFAGSLITLIDYEKFKYLIYLYPTFSISAFNTLENVPTALFVESMIGCTLFGLINIGIGYYTFKVKELK